MDIKINSVHFNADKKLEVFIQGKINKLSQFYNEIISADVFLRLENTQITENKIAEIKLQVPGGELFAKKISKSFEESTDEAVAALKKQIQKHKSKLQQV